MSGTELFELHPYLIVERIIRQFSAKGCMPESYAIDIINAILCSHNRLAFLRSSREINVIAGKIKMGEFHTIV